MRGDLHQAVVMQFGGIFVLGVGSAPYFHQAGINVERNFVAILIAVVVLMGVVSVWAGRTCGVSIFSDPAAASAPRVGKYIKWMALFDITLFALVVALSGGLTDSSFVSLLFLVPALAMLNRSDQMGQIIVWFSVLFLLLVALKVPAVNSVASNLTYKGTANRGAYETSTILILFATVLATYAQYVVTSQPEQANHLSN